MRVFFLPKDFFKAKTSQDCTGPKTSRILRLLEFLENRHMKVVRFSDLGTGRLYLSGYLLGNHCL